MIMKNKEIVEKLNQLTFLLNRQAKMISCLEEQNDKQAQYIISLLNQQFIKEKNNCSDNYFTIGNERFFVPVPINWSEFHYDDSVIMC